MERDELLRRNQAATTIKSTYTIPNHVKPNAEAVVRFFKVRDQLSDTVAGLFELDDHGEFSDTVRSAELGAWAVQGAVDKQNKVKRINISASPDLPDPDLEQGIADENLVFQVGIFEVTEREIETFLMNNDADSFERENNAQSAARKANYGLYVINVLRNITQDQVQS